MRRVRTTALLLAACAAVGVGCGGDDSDGAEAGGAATTPTEQGAVPEQPRSQQTYTEDDIRRALKVQEADDENGVPDGDEKTGCSVAVFLTTPGQIETYAGDSVATNPSRTAGVKYSHYQGVDPSICYETFTKRLEALK